MEMQYGKTLFSLHVLSGVFEGKYGRTAILGRVTRSITKSSVQSNVELLQKKCNCNVDRLYFPFSCKEMDISNWF